MNIKVMKIKVLIKTMFSAQRNLNLAINLLPLLLGLALLRLLSKAIRPSFLGNL
jgi:hypothetical protein